MATQEFSDKIDLIELFARVEKSNPAEIFNMICRNFSSLPYPDNKTVAISVIENSKYDINEILIDDIISCGGLYPSTLIGGGYFNFIDYCISILTLPGSKAVLDLASALCIPYLEDGNRDIILDKINNSSISIGRLENKKNPLMFIVPEVNVGNIVDIFGDRIRVNDRVSVFLDSKMYSVPIGLFMLFTPNNNPLKIMTKDNLFRMIDDSKTYLDSSFIQDQLEIMKGKL